MKSTENMTKYSLRSWVLVLALAPTVVVGILLGSYFTINRFYELEDTLMAKGSSIIEPLALASEFGIITQDRISTKKLLSASQMKNASLVLSLAVFDSQNQLFVTSHYHKDFEIMRTQLPLSELNETEFSTLDDILIIRSPIIANTDLDPLAFIKNDPSHYSVESGFQRNHLAEQSIAKPIYNNKQEQVLGYIAILVNKESALLEQHRAAIAAFIIVLIGVQFNLFFTFRLVKHVNHPITEMVRVVAKIREGKLDTRLDGNLIGELDLLKRGINAMAGSLSEYHDEMQQNIDQATSDLRETLEQIEIQNVELDLAKKRALEASRIKSEFLANMSHELRTPLNGVIGFARQLIKTPLHSSQLDYIKTIERSASNLLGIINDILDFSKLEAGKMVFEKMPFALRETLADTLNIIAGSAREKGIELVIDIDSNVPESVSGDAMRVNQIITNLVGNAIKFTDKGSVILKITQVGSTEDNVTLRCEVIDTGIGIDESKQEYLFQAFGQADSSISRRFGGTGLGLVITKRLINQMGGQIGFTSSPNKGSNFWFILPLSISQFDIGEVLPMDVLSGKSILLFEPRELTRDVLNQRLEAWHLKLTSVGQLDHLNTTFEQPNIHFDYILMSCHGFSDPEQITSTLKRAKQHTNCLILLHDCIDQEVIINHLKPNTDLLITVPISDTQLARHLIYPPTPKTLQQQMPLVAENNNERLNVSVLAVDDNVANLKLIDSLLQELVFSVTTAKSGEEAIKLAKSKSFELIFMDIQMPGIDGITASQKIRHESMNRHTPIIAVTAHAIAEERANILASGMDGFLPKPIDESSLKKVINRWVAKPKFTHFDLHTLNWDLCLRQANQKPNLALEMLNMMLESIPETITTINSALQNKDQQAMLQAVHKLHGASCYCGVPTTQKLCQEIESALKHKTQISELEPEILELLDELTKVESAATQVLEQLSMDIKHD
ncbi:two-component sensor histidine kinase BarA [Shewanella subflava]|uniref:histidine kinase n=1 Tax=Shewanella subflava TaxID=2986476 RepID=A0ABT3I955_9GAMM|nr:two-component sensor histidine kinase BarA [Shewanella subflava]MCW3172597.1 two-component sensor histidine kinase BarA [Shewanella subflava]